MEAACECVYVYDKERSKRRKGGKKKQQKVKKYVLQCAHKSFFYACKLLFCCCISLCEVIKMCENNACLDWHQLQKPTVMRLLLVHKSQSAQSAIWVTATWPL